MTTKVLITAGPTQEPIDDVRYITNASSGKMGAALANEAIRLGYDATFVHGPVSIKLPECRKIRVRTAQEMIDAVMGELKKHRHSIMISTAAISDYAPEKVCGKIKSGKCMELTLTPTPKLIDEARKMRPSLFIVAFKAEHGMRKDELEAVAKDFLKKKKLDMVVANDVSKNVFGSDEAEAIVVRKETAKDFGRCSKESLAKYIWNEIGLARMGKESCPRI